MDEDGPLADIPERWEPCPHLTMVTSLLSVTLPGPATPSYLLINFPCTTSMRSCQQCGEWGQGSAETAASMPAWFCSAVQFTFLTLPWPCQSPEDCSKAASNVAAGDNHRPQGLSKDGSFQKPQPNTAWSSQP